jgi:hypothetical protein
MKHRAIAVSVLIVTAYVGITVAQAPKTAPNDPSFGTWVLNAQKSNFGGGPLPKAFIEKYEMRPNGFIVSTRSIVNNDGSPAFQQAVFKYDGKDYELWDQSSLAEFSSSGKRTPQTLSVKDIDANTVEYVGKSVGKVFVTGKRTISKDGKMMTFTAKVVTPQGQSVDTVGVFDKQ